MARGAALGGGVASGGIPGQSGPCAGPKLFRPCKLFGSGLAEVDEPGPPGGAAIRGAHDPLDGGAALFRCGMGLALHSRVKICSFRARGKRLDKGCAARHHEPIMALGNCKECGGYASTEAFECPHCGYPVRPRPLFWRVFWAILAASVIVSIVWSIIDYQNQREVRRELRDFGP